MAEMLDYSCPATEAVPMPYGPPDPPIPAGLLIEPSRRSLRIKPASRWKRWIAIALQIAVLIFCCEVMGDLWLFFLAPAVPARLISAQSGADAHSLYYRLDYGFTLHGSYETDSQYVGMGYYNQARSKLLVHAIKIGPWLFTELHRPFSDYFANRWQVLLFAFLTALASAFVLFRHIKPVPPERTPDGRIALNGLPAVARLLRHGVAESFKVSNGRIVYQFVLPGGWAVKATSAGAVRFLSGRRRGDPLIIVYDPTDPDRHCIYDMLPFTVEVNNAVDITPAAPPPGT